MDGEQPTGNVFWDRQFMVPYISDVGDGFVAAPPHVHVPQNYGESNIVNDEDIRVAFNTPSDGFFPASPRPDAFPEVAPVCEHYYVPSEVKHRLGDMIRQACRDPSIPQHYRMWFELICNPSSRLQVEIGGELLPVEVSPHTVNMQADGQVILSTTWESPGIPSGAGPVAQGRDLSSEFMPGTNGAMCCWQDCTIDIGSTNIADIEGHLKAHHFGSNEWVMERRGKCQWRECKYRKDLYFKSFAKHIATHHLCSTIVECAVAGCSDTFSRRDAMTRHVSLKHPGQRIHVEYGGIGSQTFG